MGFLKKWLGKKEEATMSYAGFWNWFREHEKKFHKTVRTQGNIEKDFFDQVSPRLNRLHNGLWLLTGMQDEQTVELVITVDGVIQHIAFCEDLVAAAPVIPGWKFTALKPAIDNDDMAIEMHGYRFGHETMQFYPEDEVACPDNIHICIVHQDFTEENKEDIEHGVHIFLDNYLGELQFVTLIDSVEITGPAPAGKELIPLSKLKSYLEWRQKEFVEKYEGKLCNTEHFTHSILEAPEEADTPYIALVNTELLAWENKASHPWILIVETSFDGSQYNGFPDEPAQAMLDEMEEKLIQELRDEEGYLWVGHETQNGKREIWFACREFRHASRVTANILKAYESSLSATFHFLKDKYWQLFEGFRQV